MEYLSVFSNPLISEDEIFDAIMNCDSKQNVVQFERLAQQCAKNNVVPFVGAGMSVPIYKSWVNLLLDMADDPLFPQLLKDTELFLEKNDYEGAASLLCNELGRARFFDALDIEFDSRKIDSKVIATMSITLLPQIFKNLMVTTNFDRVLEHVCNFSKQDFIMTPSLVGSNKNTIINWVHENENILIKLHGDIYDKESLVLFTEQYEKTYDFESEYYKIIKAIFSKKQFLFLGCSLEADRTMQLIQTLKLKHFAFVQLPEQISQRGKRIKYLGDSEITPIWYPFEDKEHLSVGILLKKLYMRIQEIQLSKIANKKEVSKKKLMS